VLEHAELYFPLFINRLISFIFLTRSSVIAPTFSKFQQSFSSAVKHARLSGYETEHVFTDQEKLHRNVAHLKALTTPIITNAMLNCAFFPACVAFKHSKLSNIQKMACKRTIAILLHPVNFKSIG